MHKKNDNSQSETQDCKKTKTLRPIVCIGGGPAGLTAAYQIAKSKRTVVVLEADPKYLGGISRTVEYKGFHFDIGGHRFFSKQKEIEELWSEILGHDMMNRPRKSRIFYRNRFFDYPLRASNALKNLGFKEAILCSLSFLWSKISPTSPEKSFEDWVTNRFGHRLFKIFFKTYTEKVWGMKCSEISADWAAQRIKGLSLIQAVLNSFDIVKKIKKNKIKTLIEQFRYPKKGPGMMWETCGELIKKLGGTIERGAFVTRLHKEDDKWTVYYQKDGKTQYITASHVISSAPISEIIPNITPLPRTAEFAKSLKYRDFITVALIAKDLSHFNDNWIYIHDSRVKVGRIQNFKSWSPYMVPDQKLTCYGLEYFCNHNDELWQLSDDKLLDLAKKELIKLNLANKSQIIDGHVVRQKKAYPVYDFGYTEKVKKIRLEIKTKYSGLHLVGRNGMHKYNNQDHAMMTSILTVKNILAGKELYDVWLVNEDAIYLEETNHSGGSSGLRNHPKLIK